MLSTKKKFRIAIFEGLSNPSHAAVARKLYRLLAPKGDEGLSLYEPRIYTVCFTKESMWSKVEIAREAECDVFVIIGQRCALFFKDICDEVGVDLSVIYVGVRHPDQLGLIYSSDYPGGNRTAIEGSYITGEDIAGYIALFQKYISRIFIPYYAQGLSGTMVHQAQAIQSFLKELGFFVELKPIATVSEALMSVRHEAENFDAVVTLEGCPANGAPEIIKFSADNDKVLFCG